jgi:hypothetical protein
MVRHAVMVIGFLSTLFLALLAYPQDKKSTEDLRGNIVGENVYNNPALGLKIMLPGTWELLPRRTTQSTTPSNCRGPLCGHPEIDVTITTKGDSSPTFKIFLSGYKLSLPYQNRDRYPLSKFSEVMMEGSLEGSGLAPIGTQTAIQLDGNPAFRLLAGKPGENVASIFGYVFDDNGYICLLVGSVSGSPHDLQSAIETMKLRTVTH